MTWVKKVKKPHSCDPPKWTKYEVGSLWKCWRCKSVWRLAVKMRNTGYVRWDWHAADNIG